MKNRLTALAGGLCALVAVAVVPLGSAHGAVPKSVCPVLQAQNEAVQDQLIALELQPQTPSVQAQEKALQARASQILLAGFHRCFG